MKRLVVHWRDIKTGQLLMQVIFCFSILWLLTAVCLAQEVTQPERRIEVATATNTDSLRAVVNQLKHEAQELRMRADSIRAVERPVVLTDTTRADSLPEVTSEFKRIALQIRDTVQVLTKESMNAFLLGIRGKKRSARDRGYGGGIGINSGVYAVDMSPVHDLLNLISYNSPTGNIAVPVGRGYHPLFLMGGVGYGAVGNGLRIGGGGLGGSASYSTVFRDSTYTVEVRTNFGGLLIEKAHVDESLNWFFGGFAGGGSIQVMPSVLPDIFTAISTRSVFTYSMLNAHFLLLELHTGFTYTMISWFHLGGGLSAPLFFCPSGFKTPSDRSVTDGFITFNPGLQIRIILGNIG